MLKYILSPLLIALLFACNSNTSAGSEQAKAEPTSNTATVTEPTAPPIAPLSPEPAATSNKGKVIENLTANGVNYALYLPQAYNDTAKLPVIIFFDPHKHGYIPLNLYNKLAEKAGYILIGSNDSENGIDLGICYKYGESLINVAKQKYHIDETRITYAGFSGGSKVAIYGAFYNPEVDALIYSGSALPLPNTDKKIQILGITGVDDMNYSELVQLKNMMDKRGIENYFIEGKGKHEWPGADLYKYAFTYPFSSIPKTALAQFDAQKQALLAQEQAIKTQYNNALLKNDATWWTNEISRLQKESKTDKTGMSSRLIGYVSLACYSLSGKYLFSANGADLPNADRALTIYQIADPKNTDMAYFRAIYYAKASMGDKVLPALEKAIAMGFTDFAKMKAEPSFAALGNPDVMAFINKH
jgi:hypothetical protein